jgi:hypothetical protein
MDVQGAKMKSMVSPQMYLIELFLPLADNQGAPFPAEQHEAVEQALTEKFGGVTAYARAPASGRWKSSHSEQQQDDLIIYEVMTAEFDEPWWKNYRARLEAVFRQQRLLVRLHSVRLL